MTRHFAGYASVVGAGSDVVAIGGVRPVGRGRVAPVSDTTGYSVPDGAWRRLEPAPFDPPLLTPGAVWTGSEVIVVGNPCRRTTWAENATDCGATLRAGAFSVAGNRWRRIAVPDAVRSTPSPLTFIVSGIGWTGRKALFEIGQTGSTRWLYDPAKDRWHRAPAPDASAEVECFVDGSYYAARDGNGAPPRPIGNTGVRFRDITTWRLDTNGAPTWVPLAPAAKPAVGALNDFVSCSPGGQLWWQASLRGGGLATMRFSAASATWRAVPTLPILVNDAAAASVRSRLVVWPGQGRRVPVLQPHASSWTSLARPALPGFGPSVAGAAGGRMFVALRGPQYRTDLALIDPAATAARG